MVIKNNALGQIKWEQMVFLGNPEYVCELQPIDFAAVARGFGVAAMVVANGFSCREQIEQATGRSTLHVAELLAKQETGSA